MRESLSLYGGLHPDNTEIIRQTEGLEIQPLVEDYAIRPIEDAFDWPDILQSVSAEHDFPLGSKMYLVAFRSRRRSGVDEATLHELDESAHQEATGSPGFLLYFKGGTDPEGNCLSFCLWESMEEAKKATSQPAHREAASRASEFYYLYTLEMRHTWLDGNPEGFSSSEPMIFTVGDE